MGSVDDNTAKVLIAAVGAIAGLVTGIAVAAFGFRLNRSLERDRRDHEAEVRWLADRRALYARFMLAATAVTNELSHRQDEEGRQAEAHPPVDLSNMELAYHELRLMAPSSALPAIARLYAKLVSGNVLLSGPADDPADEELRSWRLAALGDLGDLWGAVLAAFREDLGVGPEAEVPDEEPD